MPCYLYANPKNPKQVVEVYQGMNDVHEYEVDGVKWERVWTVPQATIDTDLDPFNQNQFIEKTGKNNGKLGDVWERSAELSAKRADKRDGVDPIKQKHFDNYRKKTGKEMYHETKEKSKNIEINLPAFPK
jgi:hypothetical protein